MRRNTFLDFDNANWYWKDFKFKKNKKRKYFCLFFFVYGRFLVTSNARTAPIMIMTMMIPAIPYSSVVFDAKPLAGVDVGAVVDDALLA